MVNTLKMNFSPLAVGKYSKSTMRSTQWHHQGNAGTSGLEAVRVRAIGALGSLEFKKRLAAEKREETHFFSNEEQEKWIEYYIERETAGARKRVEDTEAAVQQEQEDIRNVEFAGLTNTESEITSAVMIGAIRKSLSDFATSDDGKDMQDEDDEEAEWRKLSEVNESGYVMGTITQTVQQRMVRFWDEEMMLDKLTQLGWEDATNYLRERDKKYVISKSEVPAFPQPQTDVDATAPAPTTFGKPMECLDIVPGISQMPQVTSEPWSSHIRLHSVKP